MRRASQALRFFLFPMFFAILPHGDLHSTPVRVLFRLLFSLIFMLKLTFYKYKFSNKKPQNVIVSRFFCNFASDYMYQFRFAEWKLYKD